MCEVCQRWVDVDIKSNYCSPLDWPVSISASSDQSVSDHTESQSALGQRGEKMFFSHNPLRRSLGDHAFLPQHRQLPGKGKEWHSMETSEYLVEWKKFLYLMVSVKTSPISMHWNATPQLMHWSCAAQISYLLCFPYCQSSEMVCQLY